MAEAAAGPSIGLMLALTRAALEQAGFAEAGREARLLIAAVTRIPATTIVSGPDTPMTTAQVADVEIALRRRCRHEPLSRIVGRRGFYGREFLVTPATLDPRPETETLVDTVLAMVREDGLERLPIRVLDVGTGTGAILLTLLCELAQATGVGTDISAEALAVARQNAEALGVAGRAAFRETRTFEGVRQPFDVVVSNPPYIPSGEIDGLGPEVREYDPLLALDGGTDGLDVYREITLGLAGVLGRPGLAALEVGVGQSDRVEALLVADLGSALVSVRTVLDLSGIPRCVAVRTRA